MHIRELRLKIADLQQAEAFYHGVLKLPVLEATSDHLILQAGSTRLVFEHQAAWQGKYHFAFEVPENQIDAAHRWISPKVKMATLNGESLFTSSDHWNAHMLYFYDPLATFWNLSPATINPTPPPNLFPSAAYSPSAKSDSPPQTCRTPSNGCATP
jgi:catechol 2,3-dioxygenase-like lactoylglutathione lyase family enzyme